MSKNFLKKRKRWIIVTFLVLIFIGFLLGFKVKPVVKSVALSKANSILSEMVNLSIMEDMQQMDSSYDILKIEKGEKGEVLAVLSNAQKINYLKSHIALMIDKKFDQTKEKTFFIPMGTLSGFEILNGRGIAVPMKITCSGTCKTDFKNKFLSVGINQSLHQIYVSIHAKICVLIPGCSCASDFDTDVMISETIIVGSGPRVYAASTPCDVCKFPDSN